MYPRPDGTVYMCGGGSSGQLPEDPASIMPQQSYVDEILVRPPAMGRSGSSAVLCSRNMGVLKKRIFTVMSEAFDSDWDDMSPGGAVGVPEEQRRSAPRLAVVRTFAALRSKKYRRVCL